MTMGKTIYRNVVQSVECVFWEHVVGSSNLLIPTNFYFVPVAEWFMHRTFNPAPDGGREFDPHRVHQRNVYPLPDKQ